MNLSDFDRLVNGLRDPAVYEHPVPEVQVLETHISAVLLAGDYAYKIKKPVNFGFVDFSTLEKRRHFCGEELRLNRRFAPDLYLDVVEISGSLESPTFLKDAGPAIEYAVKMKRFKQGALLDRCIGRDGLVTASMIESFAVQVAAVHQAAEIASGDSQYGTPETVSSSVRECWEPVRRAGLLEDGSGSKDIVNHMESRLDSITPLITQRLRDGHVRECHGDLHLGNLFLADRQIHAFDCIEFNPALRWIDVANDIAFFTMDLYFHNRGGLARLFRNSYLDATSDYSLLGVLRFYEIYRALVRAKVASLREQEEAGTGLRDASAHLKLAARLMETARRTPLIIVHGLSGSGKTYLSSSLLEQSDAIRIRSDVERDRIVEKGSTRYSEDNVEAVYQRLQDLAQEVLRAGLPVIVDATFLKRSRREAFRQLADDLGVPFRILHCTAAESELRRRIMNRARSGSDASEADLDVLELQIRTIDPLSENERAVAVRYDSGSPPSQQQLLAGLALEETGSEP